VAQVTLGKNQERRLRSGHPWVFSNEIESIEGKPEPGGEVKVLDSRGSVVGVGLYNPRSLIAVRLFTRRDRAIDEALLRDRILQAIELRKRILPVESTYRMIYSEGDFLPGLIVDRYGDYLSVQSLTLGIERRIESILDLLMEVVAPAGIVCRRDSKARTYEELPLLEPLFRGDKPGDCHATLPTVRLELSEESKNPAKGRAFGNHCPRAMSRFVQNLSRSPIFS
jgi:23S rRNA (cytosine1962-C5)-methyltransferase